jgi:hypothetical protein
VPVPDDAVLIATSAEAALSALTGSGVGDETQPLFQRLSVRLEATLCTTVTVMLEPAGSDPRSHDTAAGGATVHVLPVPPAERIASFTSMDAESARVTPWASEGPPLETVRDHVKVPPGTAGPPPSMARDRSADALVGGLVGTPATGVVPDGGGGDCGGVDVAVDVPVDEGAVAPAEVDKAAGGPTGAADGLVDAVWPGRAAVETGPAREGAS